MADRNRVYRTEGVILRRRDLGETDRLVTLFSPEYGKKRAVAKGVRRPGSKKAGHLEPFVRSRLLLARGRELDIITQAEATQTYPSLRTDLELIGQGSSVLELIDRFGVEDGESHDLFHLLTSTLERLDSGRDPGGVVRYFQIRLLDHLGYRPQLFHCVNCGKELKPEDQHFSTAEGGILCPNCGAGQPAIGLPALKVLRHYQRSPFDVAIQPTVTPSVAAELEGLIEGYIGYFLERELRAPLFVRQVRQLKST